MRTIALNASLLLSLIAGAALSQDAQMPRTPAPAGANAYIISPSDGQRVWSPVTVRFGLSGMGVAPAGTDKERTGHHHLLIDVDELPALDQPVPSDDKH